MSLYNHVANKDDLLDGILDLVLAEMEPPDPAGGLPAIRAAALSAHEALKRHPWARGHVDGAGPRRGPPGSQCMDALLGRAPRRGLLGRDDVSRLPRPRRAHHRLLALGVDARLDRRTDVQDDVRGFLDRMIPVETYPYLHEHGMQHLDEGPHQDVSAFEFALDLLLGGLERLQD